MKRVLFLMSFVLMATMVFAQGETARPTFGVTLERKISFAVIEEECYEDVVVELKAAEVVDFSKGVKVTVRDSKTGNKIYKKRFSKSYLYGFSNGTLAVGKGNALTQVSIHKSDLTGKWQMVIKEKGIY